MSKPKLAIVIGRTPLAPSTIAAASRGPLRPRLRAVQ
jgi:hypothetical protein